MPPHARSAAAALLATSLFACGAREPDPEAVKRGQAEHDLALDAFKRGSMREALGHVKASVEQDDRNADAAYLGALVLLVFCADDARSPDCRYPEAEQYARRALELDPSMRDAKNTLGVILIHRGKPAEAIAVLEPLAQDMLYRSPEKSWGNLGWAYLEAGRLDEAVTALQRSVAAQPLFCVGHYRLGLAFERKKEFAAAHQAFTRALGIEEGGCSRLQDAMWGRARVAQAQSDHVEAKADLERCRDLDPRSAAGRGCAAALRKSP